MSLFPHPQNAVEMAFPRACACPHVLISTSCRQINAQSELCPSVRQPVCPSVTQPPTLFPPSICVCVRVSGGNCSCHLKISPAAWPTFHPVPLNFYKNYERPGKTIERKQPSQAAWQPGSPQSKPRKKARPRFRQGGQKTKKLIKLQKSLQTKNKSQTKKQNNTKLEKKKTK